MTWPGWERELLGAFGLAPTPQRLRFLDAWAACEGGSAKFNPLNTTFDVAGAGKYNSAGVRNYFDPAMGIGATVLTLRLPYYRRVMSALRSDGLTAESILRAGRADVAKWGTNPDCLATRLRAS